MYSDALKVCVLLLGSAMVAGCSVHYAEAEPAEVSRPETKPVVHAMAAEAESTRTKIEKQPSPKPAVKKVPPKTTAVAANDISDAKAADIDLLQKKIKEHKTREAREILNKHPQALGMVEESDEKLLYFGPAGWRVIDIVEGLRNGRLREKSVVTHIKKAKSPYKKFTYEEIQVLLKHKLPYRVINTMIVVTR
ncbi:MAG: hypothetical protein JXK04_05310 [Campylobacterales bacterium]|nr:hypothetical protein [Campylobacterales bacterium]